ncbi:MAG TPA: diguanylate cyclase [Candidatus Aquicultor sp.]|jgi:diguanylate cyclase (GGDEF)-like protein
MMMGRLSNQQADYVELKMDALASETQLLRQSVESLYLRPRPWKPTYPVGKIIHDKSGVYYGDSNADTEGDLYVSGRNKLTPGFKREVDSLNELLPTLKQISKQHSEVVYSYYVTRDSVVRGFMSNHGPSIVEAVEAGVLDPFGNWPEYPFYYVVDSKHDPERLTKWTDVYFDPGGNGWMFSVCSPVYVHNKMMGVAALDITTKQIVDGILNLKVGKFGYAFLANTSGDVLGFPERAAKDLGWRKGMKPDGLNLLKDKNSAFYQVMAKTKSQKPFLVRTTINHEPKFVYLHRIANTSFIICLVVSEQEILADIKQTNEQMMAVANTLIREVIALALLILFGSVLLALYYSRRTGKPLVELSKGAKRVAHGDYNQLLEVGSRDEIGDLSASFNKMILALRDREEEQVALTEELISQNKQLDAKNYELNLLLEQLSQSEEVKSHFETLSYTDMLTGVYNRRYLDEHFEGEFANRRDPKVAYACMILDIDNFKGINDTYGHLAGDAVLQHVVRIIIQDKRLHDVVVRFAGDEFIVLLEQIELHDAVVVAERIRTSIEQQPCVYEGNEIYNSVSIGIAFADAGEERSGQQVIKEADMALYRAKKTGRNKIIVSSSQHPAA